MKSATRRWLVAGGVALGAMALMAFAARDVIPPYGSSIARVTVSQDELWQALWNECNQLWSNNQFDTRRHGVRPASHIAQSQ